MKLLFILTLFILLPGFCFAQSAPKKVADSKKDSLHHIKLSPGEQLTWRQHQEIVKQTLPIVKFYFKHDSINTQFINNTLSPYLVKGDTVLGWEIVGDELKYRLKPKNKKP